MSSVGADVVNEIIVVTTMVDNLIGLYLMLTVLSYIILLEHILYMMLLAHSGFALRIPRAPCAT